MVNQKCIVCGKDTQNYYLCNECIDSANNDPFAMLYLPNQYSNIECLANIDKVIENTGYTCSHGISDYLLLLISGAKDSLPRIPEPKTYKDALFLYSVTKDFSAEEVNDDNVLRCVANLWFFYNKNPHEIENLYNKALSINDTRKTAISEAIFFISLNETNKASEILKKYEGNDTIPEFFYAQAMLSNPEDAIGYLQKAASIDEKFYEAYYFLSEIYMFLQDYDKAYEYITKCKDNTMPYILHQLAKIENHKNRNEKNVNNEILKKLKSMYPMDSSIDGVSEQNNYNTATMLLPPIKIHTSG
ncbi:MAG: tetratricopeptide repeat protein [Thermoplasmata archaeon]